MAVETPVLAPIQKQYWWQGGRELNTRLLLDIPLLIACRIGKSSGLVEPEFSLSIQVCPCWEIQGGACGHLNVLQAAGPSDSERRARTAAGALRDAAQRLNEEEEAMAAVVPSVSQTEKNRKVADGLAAMDNYSMGGAGPDQTRHRSSADT